VSDEATPAATSPAHSPWRRWFAGGLAAGVVAGTVGFLALTGAASSVGPSPGIPRFVDETLASGVRQVYDGGFSFFVGGGVAVLDCDADGLPDLYLAGGSNPAALYRNQSAVGGSLAFEQVPNATTDLTRVTGAYPVDIDGDGRVDLAVLRDGENVLLRGLGGCEFERANERWGFDGGHAWTVGFSATWETPDGLPTLAFGNYLGPEKADGSRRCADSALYRALPGQPRYGPPVTLSPGKCTLSVLFADWDGSGRHDLRMTNDRHYFRRGGEQLWQVEAGRQPRRYTPADGWRPLQIWGMGIASQDVTGDGMPEVFLTSQGDNRLQTLDGAPGQPTYSDIAIRRGVTAHRPFMGDNSLPSTAWHPQFEDVNNDGWVDLFISKGNVDAQAGYAADDPSDLLLGQADGTFEEAARQAGVVSLGKGRGAALADLNLDGLLDLVEVNRSANVRVWRNAGSGDAARPGALGHWLAVRLEQPGANRDAVGSWIELRTADGSSQRQLTVGGGHASGQLGWVHLGLGPAGSAELRVRWPDGETGPWLAADADQFVVIERGAPEAVPWTPPGG
jgi:hypothetical protein